MRTPPSTYRRPLREARPRPFAADLLIVDENTGAQFDCPPHMMPPLGSGLPNAGY
jgi:hypothetical protein